MTHGRPTTTDATVQRPAELRARRAVARPAPDTDTRIATPPQIDVMRLPVYVPEPDNSVTRLGALDYRRCKSRGIG